MAAERIAAELELLRRAYPNLEYRAEGHWVRIPSYPLPAGTWHRSETEVCFQIPESIPAQGPYGFYVRPGLALQGNTPIDNYTYPAPTGFGDDWGKFSWQLLMWAPKEEIVAGTNMVNFAWSIGDRFREGR